MEKKIHQGKNITRFRQMLGMKHDALASIMGEDWTQIKISRLEAKEEIEPAILEEVSNAMKIPVDAIKNFDEDSAINIISNTVNNSDSATGNSLFSYQPTFNPIDKIVEILERTIKEKDEEIARLRKGLGKKK